jgi:hypothetical protein
MSSPKQIGIGIVIFPEVEITGAHERMAQQR